MPRPAGLEADAQGSGIVKSSAVEQDLTAMKKKTLARAEKALGVSSYEGRIQKLMQDLSADPRLAPIVREFEKRAGAGAPRKFGSNGLKVNGKLFALFTQGTLVVKLPRDRVAALVAQGVGAPFDPGHGRLMKEWLTVVNLRASWSDLTKEALDFVSEAPR